MLRRPRSIARLELIRTHARVTSFFYHRAAIKEEHWSCCGALTQTSQYCPSQEITLSDAENDQPSMLIVFELLEFEYQAWVKMLQTLTAGDEATKAAAATAVRLVLFFGSHCIFFSFFTNVFRRLVLSFFCSFALSLFRSIFLFFFCSHFL